VLQDTFLFDGTIRENVAFARPKRAKKIISKRAASRASMSFAEGFEKKYDTVVGERGVKLSGGQKATRFDSHGRFWPDPRILILDEATSSLDSESEALIQEGLRYLMRARTTFVIATASPQFDARTKILVVEAEESSNAGRMNRSMNWPALLRLYTRQHGIETNLFPAPRR